MAQQVIVWVLSIVVLLFVAATFLYFYLKSFRDDTVENWKVLLKHLRLRLDKIPNLIETVRRFCNGSQNLVIADLIKLRSEGWQMDQPNAHKVQNDLAISSDLDGFLGLVKQFPELGKDTSFLALKMDFRQIGSEIEGLLETYNGKVGKYNGLIGSIFFAPIVAIFRFKKLLVLELES